MMIPADPARPQSPERWSHAEWDEDEDMPRLRTRHLCQEKRLPRVRREDPSDAWIRHRKRFSARHAAQRDSPEQCGA